MTEERFEELKQRVIYNHHILMGMIKGEASTFEMSEQYGEVFKDCIPSEVFCLGFMIGSTLVETIAAIEQTEKAKSALFTNLKTQGEC